MFLVRVSALQVNVTVIQAKKLVLQASLGVTLHSVSAFQVNVTVLQTKY